MPDYNLAGLDSRSFEQLIQSLSVKTLGPRVCIFGDGSDGGREATYEGRITWPDGSEWVGYTVVQAKFRKRTLGAEEDGKWALAQLRDELDKFAAPPDPNGKKASRRKPDY